MELGLSGKTVLVTGASKGIGKGVGQGFYSEGCTVHLVSRSLENLEAAADDAGISILAVTRKSPAENTMLRLACDVPFKLLSDVDGKVLAKYGADSRARALLVDPNARLVAFPLPHAIVGTAATEAARRATEPVLIAAQALAPGGRVLVNDPAAPDHGSVRRTYPLAEFAEAWFRHRGAAYILLP